MMRSVINGLIEGGRIDGGPQRLLFLFLKVEFEGEGASTDEGAFETAEIAIDATGTMTPVMVTDLPATRDLDFERIVDEADDVNEDWEYVMIAACPEEDGDLEERIERCLEDMATRVMTGGDLSRFLIVDRAQNPVHLDDDEDEDSVIPPTIH
ncbi:MAG: hypothetical protein RID91_04760 [Azospirillaceae bacterium]